MVGTLQRTPSAGVGGCGPNGRPTTAYTITINSQSAASLDEAILPLTEGDKSGRHHGPPMIVGGMGMGQTSAGVAASQPGTIVNVSTERFRLSKLWDNFAPKNVGRHLEAQFFFLSHHSLASASHFGGKILNLKYSYKGHF